MKPQQCTYPKCGSTGGCTGACSSISISNTRTVIGENDEKLRYFTAVFKVPMNYDISQITNNPYWVAAAWSHALQDRDLARQMLESIVKPLEQLSELEKSSDIQESKLEALAAAPIPDTGQIDVTAARLRLEAAWDGNGYCGSCGWHAALYEHRVEDEDILDALRNNGGWLHLSCRSKDSYDSDTHRGVKIFIGTASSKEEQKANCQKCGVQLPKGVYCKDSDCPLNPNCTHTTSTAACEHDWQSWPVVSRADHECCCKCGEIRPDTSNSADGLNIQPGKHTFFEKRADAISQTASPCMMGEFKCTDRNQCWEPCGELGHSKDHAKPAPASLVQAINLAQGFPNRDKAKPAEQQGLFNKFYVSRVDGSDKEPGQKHYGCAYYVLDLNHDPYARSAMLAYAKSCKDTHPQLSADIERQFGKPWET